MGFREKFAGRILAQLFDEPLLKNLETAVDWDGFNVPPSEFFNETWMLRMCLDYSVKNKKNPKGGFEFVNSADLWICEAQLPTPFPQLPRGKKGYWEKRTHSDGVVGDFTLEHRWGIKLKEESPQKLIVLEAKMKSLVSSETTHSKGTKGKGYDQISRTVGCMLEMLWATGGKKHGNALNISDCRLVVVGPQDRKDKILEQAHLGNDWGNLNGQIWGKILFRIRQREKKWNPEKISFFKKFLRKKLKVEFLSWESVLENMEDHHKRYYQVCLHVAGMPMKRREMKT